MVELKATFFRTLYPWMVAYECFHISCFYEFFLIFFFLLWLSVSLVYFMCTWIHLLCSNVVIL
jgi:hypothetical protein